MSAKNLELCPKSGKKRRLVGRKLREQLWDKSGERIRVTCDLCNCKEVSDYIPFEMDGEEVLRKFIDDWKLVKDAFNDLHGDCFMKINEARSKVYELVPYLRAWMQTLVYEDFKNKTNGVELVKDQLQPFEIFITDTEEDILSVCIKNKVKPTDFYCSWKDSVQIVTEVLWHYKERFGTCVNGPWKLPDEKWLIEKFGKGEL